MADNPTELVQPIYRDAERYDAEHWWKTDDIGFWRRMASEFGPDVLELAAGTGRLAVPVLEAGCTYTGLEISSEFLQRADAKLISYGDQVHLFRGDMRDFQLHKKFDLIFIGFNSFLHLLTDDDAKAALHSVREHCALHTRFIIDIFVPDPIFLYRPPERRVQVMTYPDNSEQVIVEEISDYDPETEINQIHWFYSTAEKKDFLKYGFTMRMFYPDTLDRLMHESGFRIYEKWGNYRRKLFDETASLQIYVAGLPGSY